MKEKIDYFMPYEPGSLFEDDICYCDDKNCIHVDCARHRSHLKPGMIVSMGALQLYCSKFSEKI